MKSVLILGQNDVNEDLAESFRERGFPAFVAPDVGEIRSFRGEYGCFSVKIGEYLHGASIVVVTEPVEEAVPDIGGGTLCHIFDAEGMRKISESGTRSPVVVLLDYFNESPPSAAVRALEGAFTLASRKYNVVFLSRFMRTAGVEGEELYRKARNAGVTFIKYESVEIAHDKDTGIFDIQVSDGANDVSLSVKHIASDSRYGASGRFASLAKKLRLKVDEAGYVSDGRYFLSPVLTGRKGVYYLGRDACADGLHDAVSYIVSAARADLSPDPECPALAESDHALIDAEKCVFCYTCYRACPHAAMEPDDENRVMKNCEEACTGCGSCATVCPGNAVTLSSDSIPEAAQHPEAGKVKVFCCENSGDIALRSILPELGDLAGMIEFETVGCGGRIGFEQLSGALRFYDKVIALVCMDDACRHFDGNKRACLQAERLEGMLEKAGLDKGRVRCIKTSHAMANAEVLL